jgi:hypothetical protein
MHWNFTGYATTNNLKNYFLAAEYNCVMVIDNNALRGTGLCLDFLLVYGVCDDLM